MNKEKNSGMKTEKNRRIKRKKILKVDLDILLLGVYYLIVIAAYILFEEIALNYRPILIEGRLEASKHSELSNS